MERQLSASVVEEDPVIEQEEEEKETETADARTAQETPLPGGEGVDSTLVKTV